MRGTLSTVGKVGKVDKLSKVSNAAKWWGRCTIEERGAKRWRLGPTSIWISRSRAEWRVFHHTDDNALDSSLEIAVPVDPNSLPGSDSATLERFATAAAGSSLTLSPALADRPIVTKPHEPFYIAPGDTIPIHVSSPLWIVVAFGSSVRAAVELPAYRPSDTWLGPNTREGEFCYATRTTCRLVLDELPTRPHRATTTISINNATEEPLLLERLSVPVTRLSLYAAPDGRLWTEDIRLSRDDIDDGLADLEITPGPPRAARSATHVSAPREPEDGSRLVRAFNALL